MKHRGPQLPGDTPMSPVRADFEKLARDSGWPLGRKSDGTYDNVATRRAYAAYRAGRNHPNPIA